MKNVVIIGAGPAGLTAAYEILKQSKDYKVTIIEKENQVGGISKTISLSSRYLVDTGIHRFFSKDDRVNQIWQELLPIQSKPAYDDIILNRDKKFPIDGSNPENEAKSMLLKDRVTRILYNKKFFDYPVTLNWNTLKNLGFKKTQKIMLSYIKTIIHKEKETSLENFYINRFGKELYETFFKNYTEKVWGISPANMSAEWGAQRVKGISIFEIIKDIFKKKMKLKNNKHTSLIEQFYYPKLGAGQMWQVMAEEVEKLGGEFIFNNQVEEFSIDNVNIKSIELKDNKEINTDIVISSIPIKELVEKIGKENFPNKEYKSAIKLPYRDFILVYVLVDKLKIQNATKIKTINNIIPDSWVYIQENSVKMGRMQIFNNWSPYLFENKNDIKEKVLVSFEYFATVGDELWNKTEEEMIKFAIAEAKKINIIDNVTIYESKEFKIEKAYPAYWGTYKDMPQIKKALNNIENLYCVGRNGQHRYNNMDHSMLTGIEVANCILNNTKSKENVWSINTEKEYHEIRRGKK